MRNRTLFLLVLGSLTLMITSGVSDVASNAAPLGSTGAPGENTCAKSTCHTGSNINSGTALLNLDFSGTTYQPTETYNITVSLQQSNIHRFGFQLLALNSNDESTGTFLITDSNRTQLQSGVGVYEGRNYVTYKYAGTEPYSTGVGQWSFQWKAPAIYEGEITFYTAAVAANNDASDAGDSVYTQQLTIQASVTGMENTSQNQLGVSVFPKPATSLLNIRYTSSKESATQITLTDLLVQNVYASVSSADDSGVQQTTINVSQLPVGIYLLHLVSGNITETQKVVITK